MAISKVSAAVIVAFHISTILNSASASDNGAPLSAASEDDVRAANHELIALNNRSQSKCIQHEGRLQYIGATNLQLVDCLLSRTPETHVLTISSTGGAVEFAIWAADILDRANMDLHVLGFCASSCANYLVPVAERVFVDRISTMSVHGGPKLTGRSEVEAMLESSGMQPSDPGFELAVEQNLARLNTTFRIHEWFVSEHDIGQGYYDLGEVEALKPDASHIVDPEALAGCGPSIESLTDTSTYKQDIRRAYGNTQVIFLSDMPGYDPCT